MSMPPTQTGSSESFPTKLPHDALVLQRARWPHLAVPLIVCCTVAQPFHPLRLNYG